MNKGSEKKRDRDRTNRCGRATERRCAMKSEVEEREGTVTTEGGKVITLEESRWTYLAES